MKVLCGGIKGQKLGLQGLLQQQQQQDNISSISYLLQIDQNVQT